MVYVVYWSQTKGLRVSKTFSPLVLKSRLIFKCINGIQFSTKTNVTLQ